MRAHQPPAQLPVEGELASLGGATGWLNSPPLTASRPARPTASTSMPAFVFTFG